MNRAGTKRAAIGRRTGNGAGRAIGLALFIAGVVLGTPGARAEDWRPYANPRFGYQMDLPADFLLTEESANGDGITLSTEDGESVLYVFGAALSEPDFAAEIKARMQAARVDDGWKITYEQLSPAGASFSGTLGGRILYVRAVPLCDGAAGYFQLEYPEARLKAYDAVVKRMVDTLTPLAACKP